MAGLDEEGAFAAGDLSASRGSVGEGFVRLRTPHGVEMDTTGVAARSNPPHVDLDASTGTHP